MNMDVQGFIENSGFREDFRLRVFLRLGSDELGMSFELERARHQEAGIFCSLGC